MVVTIKNPVLKKRIFKQMDSFDSKALKCYKKGDIKCGKRWEKRSDVLYKKNYNKIFKVVRN